MEMRLLGLTCWSIHYSVTLCYISSLVFKRQQLSIVDLLYFASSYRGSESESDECSFIMLLLVSCWVHSVFNLASRRFGCHSFALSVYLFVYFK